MPYLDIIEFILVISYVFADFLERRGPRALPPQNTLAPSASNNKRRSLCAVRDALSL